jgi:hypothetical protein
MLNLISNDIPKALRGIEVYLSSPNLKNANEYEMQIFNNFSIHDLAFFKIYLHIVVGFDLEIPVDTEYNTLLSDVINRMAATSGVMSGMTKTQFQTAMGSGTGNPISVLLLPVWLYLQQIPDYSYTLIPGLAEGMVNPSPYQVPSYQYSFLSGAYQAQAKLQYDSAVTSALNHQDNNAAIGDAPPQWITLSTAANLKKTAMIRRRDIRNRIKGINKKERDAISTITNGIDGAGY